jgi:hypothetical protein
MYCGALRLHAERGFGQRPKETRRRAPDKAAASVAPKRLLHALRPARLYTVNSERLFSPAARLQPVVPWDPRERRGLNRAQLF